MEAFMSYGPRSNRQLLLHYGFALEANEYETCAVQFRLAGTEEREERERKIEKLYTATLFLLL
eukprot:3937265-Rhodomonas_salina.1